MFTELAKTLTGLTMNNRTADSHFGKSETIDALQRLGRLWNERFPAVPISVGHISRKNGAIFPPHKSHRFGVDADIRPMRNDLQNLPVVYQDKVNYNRAMTQELIMMLRDNTKVKSIFFNDPVLIAQGLCLHLGGHDNHLHVRFNY